MLWKCILHGYASTNWRRYAQKPLHREVCAQINFYTQTPLHTEVFTQRNFRHMIFLYTNAFNKDAFTRKNTGIYTQNLLHRETFAQNSFYTKNFLHRKALTEKTMSTHTAQWNFYTPKLLHAETLPRSYFTHICFPHRSLYAQNFLCIAVFTQTLLPTDAFTQKYFYAQKLLRTARFYTQPVFKRRGFGSPSWSPIFRVPLSSKTK